MDKCKEILFDVHWGNAFPVDYLVKPIFFIIIIL